MSVSSINPSVALAQLLDRLNAANKAGNAAQSQSPTSADNAAANKSGNAAQAQSPTSADNPAAALAKALDSFERTGNVQALVAGIKEATLRLQKNVENPADAAKAFDQSSAARTATPDPKNAPAPDVAGNNLENNKLHLVRDAKEADRAAVDNANVASSARDTRTAADDLTRAARDRMATGDIQGAVVDLEKAAKLRSSIGDLQGAAAALDGAALLRNQVGDVAGAMKDRELAAMDRQQAGEIGKAFGDVNKANMLRTEENNPLNFLKDLFNVQNNPANLLNNLLNNQNASFNPQNFSNPFINNPNSPLNVLTNASNVQASPLNLFNNLLNNNQNNPFSLLTNLLNNRGVKNQNNPYSLLNKILDNASDPENTGSFPRSGRHGALSRNFRNLGLNRGFGDSPQDNEGNFGEPGSGFRLRGPSAQELQRTATAHETAGEFAAAAKDLERAADENVNTTNAARNPHAAAKNLERAARNRMAAGDLHGAAANLEKGARIRAVSGDFRGAASALETASALRRLIGDLDGAARDRQIAGLERYMTGNIKKAADNFEKANWIRGQGSDPFDVHLLVAQEQLKAHLAESV